MKKIFLYVVVCLSLKAYGTPKWVEDLKSDFFNDGDQDYIDFFCHPSGNLLCFSLAHTGSLAFKKAWNLKQMSDSKHFESQYRLCLLVFACEYWEAHGTEEDDVLSYGDLTAQGELMKAIREGFLTLLRCGFVETLNKEEYETFLSFVKSFYAKYYKIYPEKLKQDTAFE